MYKKHSQNPATETNTVQSLRENSETQTLLPKQKDASNQHNLPHITPEDLRGDNEKNTVLHMFYFISYVLALLSNCIKTWSRQSTLLGRQQKIWMM